MSDFHFIVVGAGAAGAAVAWRLVEKGYKVLCLDRGPHMDAAQYPSTATDWEIQKREAYNPVIAVRQNAFDYPVDDGESPIAICNYNAVGGSTILYSGHFPRFLPPDFALKSREGLGENWPIGYNELAPYFALNEDEMGMSGLVGDPYYPDIQEALPPVPLGIAGETLGRAFNAKGWHWWPSYAAISTRERNGRNACLNLGPCNTGCPQGAKASVDITYLKKAVAKGLVIEAEFAVSKLLYENGKVAGVEGYDCEGQLRRFEADNVILASSAIGTPRLLLNSASQDHPQGLANTSGMVGRNLMIHPLGYVEGLFEERLDTDSGPQGSMLYSLEFYRNEGADHKLGYMMHALRGTGPVEAATSALQRRKLRFGASLYDDFDQFYAKQMVIAVICEDLPERENRLELDPSKQDRFGAPGVKIHYQLHENTKKMMIHGMSRAREVLAEAGAKRSYAYGPVRNTGWHILGTARMGDSPVDSVVNRKGQAHDVGNLFIVDSSVFVTSSCVNPANTIQSLSLYLADRINETVR